MENENGQNEVKQCPFLKDLCIEDKCALYSELVHTAGAGIIKKVGICSFIAQVMILSEINIKQDAQRQKYQLPKGLYKG
jgi:hypothetical protein